MKLDIVKPSEGSVGLKAQPMQQRSGIGLRRFAVSGKLGELSEKKAPT